MQTNGLKEKIIKYTNNKLNGKWKMENGILFHAFTLLETLIVIAIVSLLSVVGGYNLITFQKDTRLDAFVQHFSSSLKTAKNKSVNGEIPIGYILSDFDKDALPHWVVDVGTDKYSLYSKFKLADATDATGNSEDAMIVDGNSIIPTATVDFERLSGRTTATCFKVKVSGYSKEAEVYIDGSGIVSYKCP